MKHRSRAAAAVSVLIGVIGAPFGYLFWCTLCSVGTPVQSTVDVAVRENIEKDVLFLAQPRSESHPEHYEASAKYLRRELEKMGWSVDSENVPGKKKSAVNLWVTTQSESSGPQIIAGAHYDAAYDSPGADDNASGTAIALEMARRFFGKKTARPLRIAFFANEEPPHFRTNRMGSYVMVENLIAEKADVCAMFSLEMLGYFDSTPGSQNYPWPLSLFYPDTGDFVGVVGRTDEREMVKAATAGFHEKSSLRAIGFAGPSWIEGIDYSDHMPFWNAGFPALMITDTSFFRNPNYHRDTDTVDTLDFDAMTHVANGIESTLSKFANDYDCDLSD